MMTVEERLENMERELGRQKRRNRWLLGAILLVAGSLIVARAQVAGTVKHIRARSIYIEDEKGERRAALGVNEEDNPFLSLWNKNGKTRAALGVNEDSSILSLSDEKGNIRASLSGSKDDSILSLWNEKGKIRTVLAVVKDEAGLSLYDEKGECRAALLVDKDGPTLGLHDENGHIRFAAGKTATVSPDGKTIEYPESSLILFGPNGKAIWSAIR